MDFELDESGAIEISGDEDEDMDALLSSMMGAQAKPSGGRRVKVGLPQKLQALLLGLGANSIAGSGSTPFNVAVLVPFRPKALVLKATSQVLDISGIQIGTSSQLAGTARVAGEVFAPNSVRNVLKGDTANPGSGIDVTATNPTSTAILAKGAFFGLAAI